MTTETVLVTGVSGFIPSAIARALVAAGQRVVGISRSEASTPGRFVEGAEIVRVPDYGSTTIDRILQEHVPNVIVNGAAAGVATSARAPEALLDGNVGLPARLLVAAAGVRPRLFVHIGSCSEYAPPTTSGSITEDHPLVPISTYGGSKAAGGTFAATLAGELGVPFVVLRPFGVYGPGEAAARLLPWVLARLSEGRHVPLTSGVQIRDFLNVADLAKACVAVTDPERPPVHGVYNVCSGTGHTVRSVVERAAAILGASPNLLGFGDLPQRGDEPAVVVGDRTRFSEEFGWRPRVGLDDGIRAMLRVEGVGAFADAA